MQSAILRTDRHHATTHGDGPDSDPPWLDRTRDYPFFSRFVDIEGNRVHYVDEGGGPTLLLLHANPLWSFYFRNVIRGLRATFRCIALDNGGELITFEVKADRERSQRRLASVVELDSFRWDGPLS